MRAWIGLGLLWASAAGAVDQPSTYAGCASRDAQVAWGGSVTVDLSACHSFGLGVVARKPQHGSAVAGDPDPVDSYVYTHAGTGPTGAGSDSFVVLDDNSDLITVRIGIRGSATPMSSGPTALPALVAGTPLSLQLSAAGGTPPYTFLPTGAALPPGLALAPSGLLEGTPTQRGPYRFGVQVRDAGGASVQRDYAGVVAPGPLSLVTTRATLVQGASTRTVLAAAGGVPPHRFLAEAAAGLPTGLQLAPDGLLAGVTAVPPGAYPVRLRVTDSSTGSGEHFELETLTVEVVAPPTVTLSASPASVEEQGGQPLVFTLTRSAALDTATVVNLGVSGTARFATRERAAPRAVVIPAGARSATFRIRPIADSREEPDETVVFTLESGAGYAIGTPASATATVRDGPRP